MPPPHSPPSHAAASSLPLSRTTTPSRPYPLIYHSTPSPQLRKVYSTLSPVPLKHSFVYILYAASTQPSEPRCRLLTASEPHYHPLPPSPPPPHPLLPPILSSTTPLPLLSLSRHMSNTRARIVIYNMLILSFTGRMEQTRRTGECWREGRVAREGVRSE